MVIGIVGAPTIKRRNLFKKVLSLVSSQPYVSITSRDEQLFIRQLQEASQTPFDWVVIPELVPAKCTSEIRRSLENLFNGTKHVLCALAPRHKTAVPKNTPAFMIRCDAFSIADAVAYVRGYLHGLSSAEIRQLEHTAISCGMTERVMIENAARAVEEVIESRIRLDKEKDLVTVLAGTGNNGADALVVARDLVSLGYRVSVFVLRLQDNYSAGFQETMTSCVQLGMRVSVAGREDVSSVQKTMGRSKLVVDGIFGIGFRGTMPEFHAKIVEYLNRLSKKKKTRVIAIDVPSGISADYGRNGCAVRAEYTVTFFAEKKGFYFPNAFGCCGKILLKDIGVNRQMLAGVQ